MARLHYCPWCSEDKKCPYQAFFQDGDKPRDPRTFFQPSHVHLHTKGTYYYLRIPGLGGRHFKRIEQFFPPCYKVRDDEKARHQTIIVFFNKDRDPRLWKIPHLSALEKTMPSFWKPFLRPKVGFMDFFQPQAQWGSYATIPIDHYRDLRAGGFLKDQNVLLFREPSALIFDPPAPETAAPVLSISAVQTVFSVAPSSVGASLTNNNNDDDPYIIVPKKAVRLAKQQIRATREALRALDPYVHSALRTSPEDKPAIKSASVPPSPKTIVEYVCRKCGDSSFRSRNALFDHIYSNTCEKSSKTQSSIIADKNTLKVGPSGRCYSNEDVAASSSGRPASPVVQSPVVQPPTPKLHDIPEWRRAPSPVSPTPNLEERHRKYLEYRRRVPLPKPSRIPVLRRFAPGSMTALTEALLAEWKEATAAVPATVSPAPTAPPAPATSPAHVADTDLDWKPFVPKPLPPLDLSHYKLNKRYRIFEDDPAPVAVATTTTASPASKPIASSPSQRSSPVTTSTPDKQKEGSHTPDGSHGNSSTSTPHGCRTCTKSFASRNLLFAHLHDHSHCRPAKSTKTGTQKSFKIKNTSWHSGKVIQMDFGVLGEVISKLTAVASAA